MATLSTLVQESRLFRVTIKLKPGQFDDRLLYAFPECLEWMRTEVPKMKTGVIKSDFTPRDQLGVRLTEWITGKQMVETRMFRHMKPLTDDVIELKTDDLRIFGWLYQAGKFIAVRGGYTDDYKGQNKKKNYEDEVKAVVEARDALPLDGEKIWRGDFNDIC